MRLFTILLSILLLSGCAASRYAKKAEKFEEAGLYKNAAEYYYLSVLKNGKKVETKLGLHKNGQLVLNDLLNAFDNDYKNHNNQDAVYHYLEAKSYSDKLKAVQVDLTFGEIYHELYKEVKGNYLAKKYIEGTELLQREEFSKAENIFGEIIKISPEYKDAREQYTTSVYEPKYRQGNKYIEMQKYRSAYYTFKEINDNVADYKDTKQLQEQAREHATLKILITDLNNKQTPAGYTKAAISNAIYNMRNPFIKLIDAESLNPDQLYTNGKKINTTALNLLDIDAVLQINILDKVTNEGKLRSENQPAYIKYKETVTLESGEQKKETKYRKTTYKKYSKTNSAVLKVQYTCTSTSDGTILFSDISEFTQNDHVSYSRYNGKTDDIVPGYWKDIDKDSDDDVVYDNVLKIMKLKKELKASDNIKSSKKLMDECIQESLYKIAGAVNDYNPEK